MPIFTRPSHSRIDVDGAANSMIAFSPPWLNSVMETWEPISSTASKVLNNWKVSMFYVFMKLKRICLWCLTPLSTIFQLYRGGSINIKCISLKLDVCVFLSFFNFFSLVPHYHQTTSQMVGGGGEGVMSGIICTTPLPPTSVEPTKY